MYSGIFILTYVIYLFVSCKHYILKKYCSMIVFTTSKQLKKPLISKYKIVELEEIDEQKDGSYVIYLFICWILSIQQ